MTTFIRAAEIRETCAEATRRRAGCGVSRR